MASKDFKKAVKTISHNFQRYTEAMEADIQVLISSMLEVIEAKIVGLRKLLKLKLCIKNVKALGALECIKRLEDLSASTTLVTVTDKNEVTKKNNGSLEDLSSMIYEADKESLPAQEDRLEDEAKQKKLKYLEQFADIESLCSALNLHNTTKFSCGEKENPLGEQNKEPLERYIYMLLDDKRNQNKNNPIHELSKKKSQKIGDFSKNPSKAELTYHSQESVIYLGKNEYQSIMNILNMVLKSYKMQEEISKKSKIVEKTKTEPSICTAATQIDDRKIASDSICQQKEEKKQKNRKYGCL